MSFFRRI